MKKVVISGGGTGGHIFPAIAIANEIKAQYPDVDILFVGAEGKMEMEKVPQAGYTIVGLPIVGLQRKLSLQNLVLPFKLISSMWKARTTIKKFNPEVVVGVGGYASGPTLQMASWMKIPTILQEQNSFAGKTNMILGKKAKAICTAYPKMDRFFPKETIVETGNPVRTEVTQIEGKREIAGQFFGLNPNRKTVLIIGGSLGARTLNESILSAVREIEGSNIQVIWQCGKTHYQSCKTLLGNKESKHVYLHEFIREMDLAYAAADIIVSRAGAIAVSELTLIGKPIILVPSPNVAEDHQTHNAMALVNQQAAILVKDVDAKEHLFSHVFELVSSEQRQSELARNIKSFARPNATKDIVAQIVKHSK